jgi:transglutaminase-like putative cysteine protease
VLLLWAAGLGVLARRELGRRGASPLADAAARVVPGAAFYTVEQGGSQIGFASSTIDTVADGIRVDDRLLADLPVGGKLRRASAESRVRLSRALALRDFDVDVETEAGPIHVHGRADGDSALAVVISSEGEPADTQRVTTRGPVLLPTLVPLAVALRATPAVGKHYTIAVFDPTAMSRRDVDMVVRAESLFTVADSAALDPATRRWRAAHRDTVRAWRIAPEGSAGGFTGWVDAEGRVVELEQPGGFVLRRTAYELAAENWRAERRARGRAVRADEDIMESTAIAASAPLGRNAAARLRVVLGGVELSGFDLGGDRQALEGDTLTVARERPEQLAAAYSLPGDPAFRARFARELGPEPLLQSASPPIVALAGRLAAGERDPRVVAERINRWLYDSLAKKITVGVPNALQVLTSRRGDCNEHTQLYLALARAAGIPARGAAGLAYVDGKFYYHAWPEVYLGRWVAADPTFGQFPADAAHLRFVNGGLGRQAELLRLMGKLRVDVVALR